MSEYAAAQRVRYRKEQAQAAARATQAVRARQHSCSGFFGCAWHAVTHTAAIVAPWTSHLSDIAGGLGSVFSVIPILQPIGAGLTMVSVGLGLISTAAYAVSGNGKEAGIELGETAFSVMTGGLGNIGRFGKFGGKAIQGLSNFPKESLIDGAGDIAQSFKETNALFEGGVTPSINSIRMAGYSAYAAVNSLPLALDVETW